MKVSLIYLLLFFTSIAMAQEDKNPNVELPDFVITGNFEFIAVNSFNTIDTIQIKEGKFEIEYLPSRVLK